jgi:hypothetical protein
MHIPIPAIPIEMIKVIRDAILYENLNVSRRSSILLKIVSVKIRKRIEIIIKVIDITLACFMFMLPSF